METDALGMTGPLYRFSSHAMPCTGRAAGRGAAIRNTMIQQLIILRFHDSREAQADDDLHYLED
jgi:hypothetical protein